MLGKRIKRELFYAMAIVSLTGCYSDTSSATPPLPLNSAGADHQRLIIKLKSATFNCDADGIKKLSAASRVPLEFVHPISGESCVVTQYADSPEGLLQGQEILRQHPAVELLEQDRKMKALMKK